MDFNQPMVQISLEEQKKDSTFTFCRVDRIHPDNDGQMVMAYLFLKAQGLAGVEVSDISIDANNKNLLSHRNCKVSKLKKEAGGLSFDYWQIHFLILWILFQDMVGEIKGHNVMLWI